MSKTQRNQKLGAIKGLELSVPNGSAFTRSMKSEHWYTSYYENGEQVPGSVIEFDSFALMLTSESFALQHVSITTALGDVLVVDQVQIWTTHVPLSRSFTRRVSSKLVFFSGNVDLEYVKALFAPWEREQHTYVQL